MRRLTTALLPLPAARPLAFLALVASLAACAPAAGDARAAVAVSADASAGAAYSAETASERLSLYDLPGEWRDPSGAPLRLADLAGRPRVVALVYTSCHATCPIILRDLKVIEAGLPAERRGEVGFVLVSLDPERDTPGRLAEWGAAAALDPARWTLLSGSEREVRALAVALGVSYQALPSGEVAHTNVVTVLDEDGRIAHRRVGLDEPLGATSAVVAGLLR
jgi:protein SCO1/2